MTAAPLAVRRFLRRYGLRLDVRAQAAAFESRNPTWRCVDGAGRRVFVKAAVPGDSGVPHEQGVLRALAGVPGVPVIRAEGPGVLALEWRDGKTLWAHRRAKRSDVAVDGVVGRALARLQFSGASKAKKASVLGTFADRLLWTSPEVFATLSPASIALFRQVQSDDTAMHTLWALIDAEHDARCLLAHGDLRQANVLLHRGEASFVDFELAGRGDPARDVGMLIADDVRAWVEPSDAGEAQSQSQAEGHARAVLTAWEQEMRTLGFAFDDELRARVIGWAGEALLRAAYTVAQQEGRVPQATVNAALGMLDAPVRWAEHLFERSLPKKRSTALPLPRGGEGRGEGLPNPATRPEPSLTRVLAKFPWAELPTSASLAGPALAEWLYANYFIQSQVPDEARFDLAGSAWFLAELTACCPGTTFEAGFQLLRREGTHAFVERQGNQLFVAASQLRPRNARVGTNVDVELPCAREAAMPGYFALISRAGRLEASARTQRFYVHATPNGALELFARLSALRGFRFEAKVLNDPRRFTRLDPVVVYVGLKDAPRLARVLKNFSRANPRLVRATTPPMTQPIACGVSTAESPAHHAESFGAYRCRLIAEAVLTSRREGRPLSEALAERFARDGVQEF